MASSPPNRRIDPSQTPTFQTGSSQSQGLSLLIDGAAEGLANGLDDSLSLLIDGAAEGLANGLDDSLSLLIDGAAEGLANGLDNGLSLGRPGEYPQEGHPLMGDENVISPGRGPMNGAPNSPPTSKNGSLSKAKASANAQAAIAAGMTEPQSAKEVDFDIRDPPTTPIVPAGTVPVCSQQSDINAQDVLCGRGGRTDAQIGNRRFRSLVQEFQPTYLLCRRKEKPLIARTIVLIIRKRGGRFLRKDEKDGAFYEIGDDKAEAKTGQALREGLDVRAARSTMDGKKKSRSRKKKSGKDYSGAEGSSAQAPPYHAEAPFGFYPPPPPYANGIQKLLRHANKPI